MVKYWHFFHYTGMKLKVTLWPWFHSYISKHSYINSNHYKLHVPGFHGIRDMEAQNTRGHAVTLVFTGLSLTNYVVNTNLCELQVPRIICLRMLQLNYFLRSCLCLGVQWTMTIIDTASAHIPLNYNYIILQHRELTHINSWFSKFLY
jgi:hypothetical protein